MQEKDGKIIMVWGKINLGMGMQNTWEKTMNDQGHWMCQPKVHTVSMSDTWIYTVFESTRVGENSLSKCGVLSRKAWGGIHGMLMATWTLNTWQKS